MAKEHGRAAVSEIVREFYGHLPFNYDSSPQQTVKRVEINPIQAYADLDSLLRQERIGTVLEFGCGTGWASNAIALHYRKRVTAVDMTERALERAKDVARKTGVLDRTEFIQSDFFDFQPSQRFDLVLSIGVLHHTYDCRKAFGHIAQFVARGGYIFVGLYHLYARCAFQRMFRDILEQGGEDAAFLHYKRLNPNLRDETRLRSWFRDQVLHPQETQHTLEEVFGWLDECGLALVTTSINHYDDVSDRKALIGLEAEYEALSEQRNIVEGKFFPGFFTVLASRKQ